MDIPLTLLSGPPLHHRHWWVHPFAGFLDIPAVPKVVSPLVIYVHMFPLAMSDWDDATEQEPARAEGLQMTSGVGPVTLGCGKP
ncbi:hypothetical protein AHAS_Ahas14G0143300 [Arachis hypogaea]